MSGSRVKAKSSASQAASRRPVRRDGSAGAPSTAVTARGATVAADAEGHSSAVEATRSVGVITTPENVTNLRRNWSGW